MLDEYMVWDYILDNRVWLFLFKFLGFLVSFLFGKDNIIFKDIMF